jgi:hypothetical protein
MKKTLVLFIAVLGLTTACEKEEITPQKPKVVAAATEPNEKAEARKINTCHLRASNGDVLAEGQTCQESGGTCGRKPRCSAKLGGFPDNVVFQNMTQRQVVELWNTDEGMAYLMSKGVYAVTDL